MLEDEMIDVFHSTIKDVFELYDTVKCCICCDIFKNPVTIKCKHTFCDQCLKDGNIKCCPICRLTIGRRDKRYNERAENLATFVTSIADNIKDTAKIDIFSDLNFLKRLKSDQSPKNDEDVHKKMSPIHTKGALERAISSPPGRRKRKSVTKPLAVTSSPTIDKPRDAFDALMESSRTPSRVKKPARTYKSKPRAKKEEPVSDKILPFEDDSGKDRIVQWLTDSQNEFDRFTQTQQGNVEETHIEGSLMSISQAAKRSRLDSRYYKEIKDIKKSRAELSRASSVKRRCRSLEVQVHKATKRSQRLLRQSIGCDTHDLEMHTIEEVDSEPIQSEANKADIIQLIEDECLKIFDEEFVEPQKKSPEKNADLDCSKPITSSGWARMQLMNKSIRKSERKPKKLKINKTIRTKKSKADNSTNALKEGATGLERTNPSTCLSIKRKNLPGDNFVIETFKPSENTVCVTDQGAMNHENKNDDNPTVNLKDMESFFNKHISDTINPSMDANSEYSLYLPENRHSPIRAKAVVCIQKIDLKGCRGLVALDRSNERNDEAEFACQDYDGIQYPNRYSENFHVDVLNKDVRNVDGIKKQHKDVGNVQNAEQHNRDTENMEIETRGVSGVQSMGTRNADVINVENAITQNKAVDNAENTEIWSRNANVENMEINSIVHQDVKIVDDVDIDDEEMATDCDSRYVGMGKENLLHIGREKSSVEGRCLRQLNIVSVSDNVTNFRNNIQDTIKHGDSSKPDNSANHSEKFSKTGDSKKKSLSKIQGVRKYSENKGFQDIHVIKTSSETLKLSHTNKKNALSKTNSLPQVKKISVSEHKSLPEIGKPKLLENLTSRQVQEFVKPTYSENNDQELLRSNENPDNDNSQETHTLIPSILTSQHCENSNIINHGEEKSPLSKGQPITSLFKETLIEVINLVPIAANTSTESYDDAIFSAPTQKLRTELCDDVDEFQNVKFNIERLRESLHSGYNLHCDGNLQILQSCITDLQHCISILGNTSKNLSCMNDEQGNGNNQMETALDVHRVVRVVDLTVDDHEGECAGANSLVNVVDLMDIDQMDDSKLSRVVIEKQTDISRVNTSVQTDHEESLLSKNVEDKLEIVCSDKSIQTSMEERGFHITSNEFFKSPAVQDNEAQTDYYSCLNCHQSQGSKAIVDCKKSAANIYSLSPSFDDIQFDTQAAILEHESYVKNQLETSVQAKRLQAPVRQSDVIPTKQSKPVSQSGVNIPRDVPNLPVSRSENYILQQEPQIDIQTRPEEPNPSAVTSQTRLEATNQSEIKFSMRNKSDTNIASRNNILSRLVTSTQVQDGNISRQESVTQILDNLQNFEDDGSVIWDNSATNQVTIVNRPNVSKQNETCTDKLLIERRQDEVEDVHMVDDVMTIYENDKLKIPSAVGEVLEVTNIPKSVSGKFVTNYENQVSLPLQSSNMVVSVNAQPILQYCEDRFKRIRSPSSDSDSDIENPKKVSKLPNRLFKSDVSVQFDTESQTKNIQDSSEFSSTSMNMDYIDQVWNKIDKGLIGNPGTSKQGETSEAPLQKIKTQELLEKCDQIVHEVTMKNQARTEKSRSQEILDQCDQLLSKANKTITNKESSEAIESTPKITTQDLLDKYDQIINDVMMKKDYRNDLQNQKCLLEKLIDNDVMADLNRPFRPDDKESEEIFQTAKSNNDSLSVSLFYGSGNATLGNDPRRSADKLMASFINENDDDKLLELYKTNQEVNKIKDIKVLQTITVKESDEIQPDVIGDSDEEMFESDGDVDVIENTPEGPPSKKHVSHSLSTRKELFPTITTDDALNSTIPPPPEFQDMNNELNDVDVTLTEEVQTKPQFAPLTQQSVENVNRKTDSEQLLNSLFIEEVQNKPQIAPLTQQNIEKFYRNIDSEQLLNSLSPITREAVNKTLNMSMAQAPIRRVSSSTPKSQTQMSIRRFMAKKPGDNAAELFGMKVATKKPCVACTRLTRDQVIAISALTNKKLATYSTVFNTNVTHMVVSTNERNCLKDHTMKFVSAVAAGIWVVSFKWIQDCLMMNKIVNEESYEVLDVSGIAGPKESRLHSNNCPLLKGFKIHAAPPFISTTQADVENIVLLLGGKVARDVEELLDKEGNICLIITETRSTQDFDQYETWLEALKVVTVDIEWLSRSVGQYKLLSFRRFALCSDDNICDLGYPSYLLENVPFSFTQSTFL